MATTERRKSISLFFGLGRQEPKTDSMPDGYPKLRRKLQKVTKQVDSTDTDTATSTVTQAPAPDVGGVQTVKVPGDETFLSTKYDSSRPQPSRDGRRITAPVEVKPAVEEKRSRRESKPRFFFRSSSTSRVPNASRSTSLTRTPTAGATASRPSSSRGDANPKNITVATAITTSTATIAPSLPTAVTTERPSTATSTLGSIRDNTGRASNYGTIIIDTESRAAAELEALGDAQDKARAQKKAAQAAAQARAVQMMEEHERISAQQRMSHSHGHVHSHSQKSMPPSASRTKRMTMLPLTLGAPQQPQGDKIAAPRPYPQFHRPYSQSQHQTVLSPAPNEVDVRRALSTAAARPSYTSRKSTTGLAPVTVTTMPMSISPLSPILSSAMSDTSSGSPNSPTSAAFNMSSASLALTAATSVNQSYSTLPTTAHGSGSSCVTSSPDGSVNSPFPYTLGRKKSTKFDFENDSIDGSTGSDDRRIVPELSYLSGGSPPDSPRTVSSADASSPTKKPRRKVKTPVYAIGQLESEASACEAVKAIANEQVELNLLQSKSSIECIAEQYRALLASRNSQSTEALSEVNMDFFSRPTSTCLGGLRSRNSMKRSNTSLQAQAAALNAQRKFMLVPPGATNAFNTDARDDSPLLPAAVFQEWLPRTSVPIYNVQSPPPPAPLPPLRTRSSMMGVNPNSTSNSIMEAYNKQRTPPPPVTPAPQSDNLGLQICVDLLTRELSSAVLHRSSPAAATAASQRAATRRHLQQNGLASVGVLQSPVAATMPVAAPPSPTDNASSALQILVMIEAYERLRDQLVAEAKAKSKKKSRRSQMGKDASTEEIEAMFGLWLKSLYRIHDSLTTDAVANGEDSYDDDEQDNTSDSDYDSAAESI
ncbi:hypothetical protein SBRCBS47491_006109 [Sporothrix bragantina]|uniref:Uncharacterized protein n=1 Tax=Sporothrix bragantina TaxID=671064 RepID=A0ABP0C4B2_9PEZI